MDIQKKYSTPDGFALAVVHAGGTRLIGKAPEGKRPGDLFLLKECIELRCTVAVLPTPQGPAASGVTITCMLDGTSDFTDVEVLANIVRYFDDMPEDEAEKYVKAREVKADDIQRQRAAKAGITLSTQMPKGGPHGGPS